MEIADNEIADDEHVLRNVTASEVLDNLDAVKCFPEVHGDKQMNVMLNELTGKVEILKSQNVRQGTTHMFFKK